MKKILVVLAAAALFFSSCDFSEKELTLSQKKDLKAFYNLKSDAEVLAKIDSLRLDFAKNGKDIKAEIFIELI